MNFSVETTRYFYGFAALIIAGVIAVLWRNYRAWRVWKDDYEKQGDVYRIAKIPLSPVIAPRGAAGTEETFL